MTKRRKLLSVCLAAIFVASLLASQVQTSFGRVQVRDIKIQWGSHDKKKKLPQQSVVAPKNAQDVVTGLGTDPEVGAVIDWLYQWARDVHAWGQDVRDDIIRLEGQAGFGSGDPGDPPDGPPEEN